jgi:ATP-dependent Clp protease ATP-binding subunit ClpA
MYERFTDRARKVIALANHEAQRFNHEYIGTEHLLLGLIKEGSGVGANVLKNLDIDLRRVRLEVEKLVKSGPDMVTMGKLPTTPRAKKVIEYAIEESQNLNHTYIGTEHLLLGLVREHDGVAAQILLNLGLKLDEVREEMLNLLGVGVMENREDINECHPLKMRIKLLNSEKDEAVKNAEYDKAAEIRDEVTELEKKVKESEPKEFIKPPYSVNYHHIFTKITQTDSSLRGLLATVSRDGSVAVIQTVLDMLEDLHSLAEHFATKQHTENTECT